MCPATNAGTEPRQSTTSRREFSRRQRARPTNARNKHGEHLGVGPFAAEVPRRSGSGGLPAWAMAAAWLGVRVRAQPAAGSSSPAVHRASRPLGHDLRDPIPVMTAWDRQPQRPPTPSPPPTPPDQSAPPRPTTARSHHRRSAPTKTDPTLAPKPETSPAVAASPTCGLLIWRSSFVALGWTRPKAPNQSGRTGGPPPQTSTAAETIPLLLSEASWVNRVAKSFEGRHPLPARDGSRPGRTSRRRLTEVVVDAAQRPSHEIRWRHERVCRV